MFLSYLYFEVALTRERCRLVALRYDRRGGFSKYAGLEYRFWA